MCGGGRRRRRRGSDPGYRIKNKNPTQSCGELWKHHAYGTRFQSPLRKLCNLPVNHAWLIRNLQKKLVQKDKEIAETNGRENHKASLIRDLQKQLAHKQQETADTIERENQKAVTIRELRKELAQKEKDIVETNERENHNVLLIRDLQEKLAQKEKEVAVDTNERLVQGSGTCFVWLSLSTRLHPISNLCSVSSSSRENPNALLIRDLQEKLAQKDKEIAETNERENHKASLIRDLQKQLAHKKKEAADTIERENQKAVMIRELRKELAWEKNEHAALVRDFEKGNDELAQRIHLQPQVDGETWQFRGDSREWISFPASLNVFIMFSSLLPFPEYGTAGARGLLCCFDFVFT